MFGDAEPAKIVFLDKTTAARRERALEKKKDASIILIQSAVRGWLKRKHFEEYVL